MLTEVVKEALPLFLPGKDNRAVLIIHGFTGYTGEFYDLAHSINKEGYAVSLPRLPGHGTNRKDFQKSKAEDWLGHVENCYLDLKAQYSCVSIIGLSMGGVLTLILASRYKPEEIVLLAPAMAIENKLIFFTPLIGTFIKEVKKEWIPEDDASDDRKKLGREYWNADMPKQAAQLLKLIRMAKAGLSKIQNPLLLILSEKDESVPLRAGDVIEKGLNGCAVDKIILKESHHVLVTGTEKETVKKEVIQWLKKKK